MIGKIFLTLVGVIYLGLAVWCTIAPKEVSGKVGLSLTPGTGQSEFLVVYGGLEFGLALIFLMPLFRNDSLPHILLACVLLHGALVVFRTVSFFLYSDFASMTYKLAIGEWVIFLAGLLCMFVSKPNP
ncbi:MAG: hypothetical protein R3C03_23545 [Pirellulaceae bacterium]